MIDLRVDEIPGCWDRALFTGYLLCLADAWHKTGAQYISFLMEE